MLNLFTIKQILLNILRNWAFDLAIATPVFDQAFSAAIAGRVLPSTNSKNAPPPVEI